MTNFDFNKKYEHFIEGNGLVIDIDSVSRYLDELFDSLLNVKGFIVKEISTKCGLAYFDSNLPEILFGIGRIMENEIENQINFLIRVETEIEKRKKRNK